MRLIRRKQHQIPQLRTNWLSGYRDLRPAFQQKQKRIKWRRVLAQSLPLIESKHRHRPCRMLHQRPAHNRPVLIAQQSRRRNRLCSRQPPGRARILSAHDLTIPNFLQLTASDVPLTAPQSTNSAAGTLPESSGGRLPTGPSRRAESASFWALLGQL